LANFLKSHKLYVVDVLDVSDFKDKTKRESSGKHGFRVRERRAGSNYWPRRCILSNSTVMITPAITIMTGTSVGSQTLLTQTNHLIVDFNGI
jgi:hypothetical protein